MRRSLIAMHGIATFLLATTLSAQQPFTLQQILSAPYASLLTAAPTGPLFAWTENAEGRHNLFVGGKDIPARQLTHNTEDDAQDISQLAWSPDAKFIAYTFGAPSGADGKPANPAHLQRPTPVEVIIQPVDGSAAIIVGEGRSPLFPRDGKNLLFTRGGQIFTACLLNCHPERSLAASSQGAVEGPASPEQPQSFPHQLVFDRGNASSLTLSPDGQTLAFISRRREANEPSHSFLALYIFATHTLTFPAPSTGNDSAPAFSPDGKQLAWLRSPFTEAPEFALNRTSPNPWSIQLLDLTSRSMSSRPEAERSGDAAERPLYFAGSRTVYSPEPNKPGSVLPIPGDESPYLLWTADNKIIFFSEADGWDHLYSLDPSTSGPPALLTPGKFEVEDPVISADHRRIIFSGNGPRHLMSTVPLNLTGKPGWTDLPTYSDHRNLFSIDLTQPSSTAEVIEICCNIATHPQLASDGTLAALVSDAWKTMRPQIIDLQHVSAKYDPPHIELHPYPPLDLALQSWYPAQPELVFVDSAGGLRTQAQLFAPMRRPGVIRHPAILFLHGGPRRQMLLGYPAMDYYSNAYAMNQYLTSRGFIVLSVNYRCGIGYGLDFRQCDHEGATGAAEYDDVLAAAKYLQSRPDVDSKRIGLWGGSYGGYLTALGLARNSDLFAAGVDFHGVHDWNLEDNASDWKQGSFAQQDAIAAKALASSPLGDISKWTSPVLLIHGDNDPDVAYAQTPHLADALRARNSKLPAAQQVDVQELIFPDELHGFLLHRDWVAAYTAASAFFERTLKPNQ